MTKYYEKARELGIMILQFEQETTPKENPRETDCLESCQRLQSLTEQVIAIIKATVYGTLDLEDNSCANCRRRG